MRDEIAEHALTQYGMEIQTVGIKRLMIPERVTEKVFERMKADRKRRTESILAAGNLRPRAFAATRMRCRKNCWRWRTRRPKPFADRRRRSGPVLSDAGGRSGVGDVPAGHRALKKILKERSTIVLGVETEPIHLLKELPRSSHNKLRPTTKRRKDDYGTYTRTSFSWSIAG